MKECGCDFCNDLRWIEPAKYIGCGDHDKFFKEFIRDACENKQFIYHYHRTYGDEKIDMIFEIVSECPRCGYKFTEADYDSYC